MKLKILVVPLVIVGVIALVIWGIVPAYGDLQIKKNTLKNDQAKLADVRGKQKNVETLFGSLSSSTDNQNAILKYLPDSRQEENLFSNLNDMVSQEGLSIFGLSISADEKKAEPAVAQNVADGIPVERKVEATNFSVKLGVTGEYEKIKSFLIKLDKLKRFNKINSIALAVDSADKTGADATVSQAPVNNIKADIDLNFSYFKKINTILSFGNPIFSTGQFDMSAIKSIEDRTSTDVVRVSIDSMGKTNPFLP